MLNIQALNVNKIKSKTNRELKKEFKRYKTAHRKYIKQLVKLARTDAEYDYGQIIDILLLMLKRRLEYYKLGDNVWQAEESRQEVIRTLQSAVDTLTAAYNYEYKFRASDTPEEQAANLAELERQKAEEQGLWTSAFDGIALNIRKWWD